MAGNVKGIIVEIGGDTSGLQEALKKVNSMTSSLSKELRGVNSLLKLDPKNTELLKQKQTLLKNEIAQTSQKLQTLKSHYQDVANSGGTLTEEQEKKFRALQREIVSTEQKLKSLKTEASSFTQIGSKLEALGSSMKSFGDKVTEAGKKVSVLSGAIAGLFAVGVKYNAQLETTTKAFETFIGSAEEADAAINNIKQDSKSSIFDTNSLIKANQYLVSTGMDAEKARETINALADAIAVTGGGNDELNRMALNLQQIQNVGKASAMDIKQFAMAGIDIYGALSDTLGLSVEQIKKMDISFDVLSEALINAASEGGSYFEGQAKMADTFNGKVAKLKKTFEELLGSISESLMPILDIVAEKLQNVADWFNNLTKEQKETIAKVGMLVVAIGPALVILGKLTSSIGSVISALGVVSKAMAGISAPVAIAVAAIGALIAIFMHLYNTNEEFRQKVNDVWNNIIDVFQNHVMPVVQQLGELIGNIIKTVWDTLQYIWKLIEPFVQKIFEVLMDWWNKTGADIVGKLFDFLGVLLQAINWLWVNVIDPVIKFIQAYLMPVIQFFLDVVVGVLSAVLNQISWVWDNIKGIFQGIIDFIGGIFTGDWSRVWEGVKEIFFGIFNAVGNFFKSIINGVTSKINGVIGMLNRIRLPDWAGGGGVNIPMIPQLAEGGIVNKATLAMIGEGKSAEAVMPLDKLPSLMAEAIKEAGGNNLTFIFEPKQMTEGDLNMAFNYVNRRLGTAY